VGVRGSTNSLAIWSASMRVAPSCRRICEIVVFPLATPPVKPTTNIHRTLNIRLTVDLLDIEILNKEGIFLDEVAPLLHLISH
jgi:hypothetical protein